MCKSYLFIYLQVPWATCGNPWNTDNCVETNDVKYRGNRTYSYYYSSNQTNMSFIMNDTRVTSSAAEEYFE